MKACRSSMSAILLALSLLATLMAVTGAAGQGGENTSSSAHRVERFPRLAEMRIPPPPGATGNRFVHACPTTLEMCQNFWTFVSHFLNDPAIPVRDRELLVLRTAWLSRVDYEWGSHVGMAEETGLTEDDISRVTLGALTPTGGVSSMRLCSVPQTSCMQTAS